jgi:serine/threonine protein kinase
MKIEKFEGTKLPLTNDGHLSIFFTGVGSAFSKKHYQTNPIIIKGNDHLMIDFGTRSSQALYELGLKVTDIQNFLVTHSHADHIGGLEEVMLMGRYVSMKKPNVVINEEYQKILWEKSLQGGCAYSEESFGHYLEFPDFWNLIRPAYMKDYPRETWNAIIGGIDLKAPRTMHIPEHSMDWHTSFWSCGAIIDERILFTSDSRFDPDLILKFDEKFHLEAIFHDCQFFTGGVHASIDELNTLPPEIKAKMYLVHYGDNWPSYENTVKEYGFADLVRQWTFYRF